MRGAKYMHSYTSVTALPPVMLTIIHNATVRAITESIRSLTAGRDAN